MGAAPIERLDVLVSGVDTDVLVRYLVQDDEIRGEAARRLFDGSQMLAVSLAALSETAFVLLRRYGVPRAEIADGLIRLIGKRNLRVLGIEKARLVESLLLCRPSGRVSFGDALIAADTRSHGLVRIYSFDQRFPADGLEVVTPG